MHDENEKNELISRFNKFLSSKNTEEYGGSYEEFEDINYMEEYLSFTVHGNLQLLIDSFLTVFDGVCGDFREVRIIDVAISKDEKRKTDNCFALEVTRQMSQHLFHETVVSFETKMKELVKQAKLPSVFRRRRKAK